MIESQFLTFNEDIKDISGRENWPVEFKIQLKSLK